ncbi:hypothetical protein CEUSTIGMA_g1690.t1 [Chlamydomonas eustigma]|uniref:Cytochrome c-553 n=1 Tax=Chlamydomonas eustigma TaxID=1157962 RepID=A0A250WTU4_9CHLO|nr:hypothetical protein CEUSTIGMA_g1690.t1 [Chlamydomonas eustigma]|eukprot:GAX74241.1 hypothetical protein CEUSTIGMA_g1690.t1 [Chlamydomonas eustigma]
MMDSGMCMTRGGRQLCGGSKKISCKPTKITLNAVTPTHHHASVLQKNTCLIASGAAAILVGSLVSSMLPLTALASDASAQALFSSKCVGCHMNGGNIVQAGATLFQEDLQRNGVSDPEALYNIIYGGKGKMPGYGTDCAPKGKCTFGPRLADNDIKALTSYVLERAEQKWQ